MQFRQILKALGNTPEGKAKLREKLLKYRHRMTERDFSILDFLYYDKFSIKKAAKKFGLSVSHFYCVLNSVLAKFEMLLTDSEFREIVIMAKTP